MKKIYITNFWHTYNYGAYLTAYALQMLVPNSYLVNNKSLSDEKFSKRYIKSEDFILNNLKITEFFPNNLLKLNNEANIFITGSDQVFRPKYCQGKLDQYLLDFVQLDKKKIAFSASFGVDKEQFLKENSPKTIEHFKNSLNTFDFISVREKTGVEICRDIFNVSAEWIIDPVFILDKSWYEKLIKNSSEKYDGKIVAYVLDKDGDYKSTYKFLSKKYDKKVIETANSNLSVEDWLSSIKNCELFITDSFHGMCFAIIFNKPFICIANKFRGKARFDSICEMLGIENQCIESVKEILKKDCIFAINYDEVNKKITSEREKGLNFLKRVLEAPVKITQEKIDSRMKYMENRILELERQNNLSYQTKKYLWGKWLVIFNYYLPERIKKIISFFWHLIKENKNEFKK